MAARENNLIISFDITCFQRCSLWLNHIWMGIRRDLETATENQCTAISICLLILYKLNQSSSVLVCMPASFIASLLLEWFLVMLCANYESYIFFHFEHVQIIAIHNSSPNFAWICKWLWSDFEGFSMDVQFDMNGLDNKNCLFSLLHLIKVFASYSLKVPAWWLKASWNNGWKYCYWLIIIVKPLYKWCWIVVVFM